jgi:hypothetical protein
VKHASGAFQALLQPCVLCPGLPAADARDAN